MDISALQGTRAGSMLGGFREFVEEQLQSGRQENMDGLLASWVVAGNVIEDFGGDYGAYMLVVALAIAQFHEDPSYYGDNASTQIIRLFELGDAFWRLPQSIDPDQWKEWVFRVQRGEQIHL